MTISPLLLVVGVLVLVLVAIGLIIHLLLRGPRARVKRRVAGLAAGRTASEAVEAGGSNRRSIQNRLKELESIRQKRRGYRIKEMLTQAGLRITPGRFMTFSALGGLLGGCLTVVAGLPVLAALGIALVFGVGVPHQFLKFLTKRRLAAFTRHFPDAIDVIVRGVRAGLPVGECFSVVARESPDPVGPEFAAIIEGQRLGFPIEEVLERASERVPTAELRYFGIVLAIQSRTGGNLAETLGKLSDVLRGRKRMKDKIAAYSSEAKASAYIIGSLPIIVSLLLFLVAPGYVSVLFQGMTGRLMLLAGLVSMGMGVMVMRRMINFDL